MAACPFFGRCGGCTVDFAAPEYRSEKLKLLPFTPDEVVWIDAPRRRAEFQIGPGAVGFFARHSNDIVAIDKCPLLDDDINAAIADIALPVAGRALITKLSDGIEIDFNSAVKINPKINARAACVSWNGKIIAGAARADFRPNGFLQPTTESEKYLSDFVAGAAKGRTADLFSGNGSLTRRLDAARFDIFDSGKNIVRDLNKNPLRAPALNKYETIVLDPPRAGAEPQCREIAKSNAPIVIYISCNPTTWLTDKKILESGGPNAGCGLHCVRAVALDQFRGSSHWEIASLFIR
ncbi:MAG: hypothetical protein LBL46_02250 [Rickettsiales bacterium]|jgi:23S rRNA (uracil1939-C5)-methyltransferase|nr:hypothetical protein [Rickettsiales bacterium]